MSYHAFGAPAHHSGHHPHGHHKKHEHHHGHHPHHGGHHHGGGGPQQQSIDLSQQPPTGCEPLMSDPEAYKACILAQYGLEGLGAFAGGHGGGGHGGGGHHGGGGGHRGGGHGGGGRRGGGWWGGYSPTYYVNTYCEQLLPYDVESYKACIFQTYGVRL